jgi:hypothetical protein
VRAVRTAVHKNKEKIMRVMMIVKATKDSETGRAPNPELMAAIQKWRKRRGARGR